MQVVGVVWVTYAEGDVIFNPEVIGNKTNVWINIKKEVKLDSDFNRRAEIVTWRKQKVPCNSIPETRETKANA